MITNPSQYQLNIFDALLNTDKNIVIQATAGSGKSSTIITGAKLLPSSISTCFLAFNKSIVENLKEKLPSNVICKTAHSFGLTALIEYYRITFKVNPYKNLRFIDEIIRDRVDPETKKPIPLKEKLALQFLLLEVIDLVRMNMLSYEPETIAGICDHHGIVLSENDIVDCIEILGRIDFYNKSFSKTHNIVDFTDMIYLAVGNPKIKLPQFDVVMVDEMQDLNRAQQLLVEKLTKRNGRIVAVGDKNQSIYGFAGAFGGSFEYFQNRPNSITLPLSISYRCGKSIVRNAALVYPDIEICEKNEEGEVREGSPNEIQKDDMVISRNTRPLITLYFLLLERGQAATVVGRDIEHGLLKLISKHLKYSAEDGVQRLIDEREKLKHELIAQKKNLSYNKKYVNLHEQVMVIEILARGCDKMREVEVKIKEMFEENKKDAVKLMTIHRCKGLEADRVFLITHFEGKKLIPSQYAFQQWEQVQENNILFVALTRSRNSLIYISL